jgi:lipopolysaccharide transport system ATP-binding protein
MSDLALDLTDVGKMYKIFPNRAANLLDALGVPGRRRYKEFWALRGIDLQLEHGKRLGIVGRNGAGKSTLLKLITGNIVPTEGRLVVSGEVQALIEAGAGFHPEFTGEENIRAALTLQGVRPERIPELIAEITEFTELGDFVSQPFRTYSAGMQARLSFATATAIEPEILIVDEMLSAGDAYFSSKAGERMRELVESGASLLLVSHSLDHITMFCEDAIWIDRGRIVDRGSSLEVVKAYQQFSRLLDERRIQARNRKAASGQYASHELDNFSDQLVARFGPLDEDTRVDVRTVALFRSGEREERVDVGDAQDANSSLPAYVLLDDEGWSQPFHTEEGMARSVQPNWHGETRALTMFNLYSVFEDADYEVEVVYRGGGTGGVRLELLKDGHPKAVVDAPRSADWTSARVAAGGNLLVPYHVGAEIVGPTRAMVPEGFAGDGSSSGAPAEPRRWPGEGTLTIGGVRVVDASGAERTVFERGETVSIEATLTAQRADEFPVVVGVSLYRLDGVLVTNHASDEMVLRLAAGASATIALTLPETNLGDARYTFSVAAFRELSSQGSSRLYDLLDRSFEFEIFGNGPFENGVFNHPAEWRVDAGDRAASS